MDNKFEKINALDKNEENQELRFRRARTKGQIASRKKEILDACEKLYSEGGYGAVNFKAISEMTSITRQAIYGYFKTKEEALLELLHMKQLEWERDIIALMSDFDKLSKEAYAGSLTSLFNEHGLMLELIGQLFNIIELNCSVEKLAKFRENSVDVYHLLLVTVAKYFPQASRKSQKNFVSTVFAFVVGFYPMNHMSEKQLKAETLANAFYVYPEGVDRRTLFQTQCYNSILMMLDGMLVQE